MSASLVGSEMCIRDRASFAMTKASFATDGAFSRAGAPSVRDASPAAPEAVSYTHLTLPTICSV
eukprot:7127545-Alexandrium_andersonii.AAC.1